MARSRTAAVTTTTVTRDAADILVSKLNEIEGISFVRDAWENKAPDNYGVVELAGAPTSLWADDVLLEQVFQMERRHDHARNDQRNGQLKACFKKLKHRA